MAKHDVALTIALLSVITEATNDRFPGGAPAGHLYAGVMSRCSYSQFTESILNLVDRGWVHYVTDNVLACTDEGRAMALKIAKVFADAKVTT
jgi:hypothetical protein